MIKLNNLSIKYNKNIIIDNLSFEFKKGFNAIVGASGEGKTSIINAILGLIPYEGSIECDSKNFSAVFEEDRLCDNFSVLQNLKLVCNDVSKIDDALKTLSLFESKDTIINELSFGMKRRIAIIRAIIADYDVLILDEPFKGLDEDIKLITMNYIKEKTSDKTVILISHDPSEVSFYNCNILRI